jgi:hypothetical protein
LTFLLKWVNCCVMKRRLVCFLLICFSFFILGLALHHHKDGVSHDDCSICSYVSHSSILTLQDNSQVLLLSFNILFISIENTVDLSSLRYHSFSNRAPPA